MTKQFKSFFYGFLTFGVLCFILLMGAKIGVNIWVKKTQIDIKQILQQQIGMPVTIGSIEKNLKDFSYVAYLKEIVVYDPEAVAIPFLSIQNAELSVDLLHYLFNQKLQFKRIFLQDTKLVIGYEKESSFSILGLKGEPLPSTIDVQALLNQLKSVDVLEIEKSEILWKTAGSTLKQNLEGKFQNFNFEGKHQLQIGDSLPLPDATLTFAWQLAQKKALLKTNGKSFGLECEIKAEAQEPVLGCQVSLENLDLAVLPNHFVLEKGDPLWAQWLIQSLKSGRIVQGNLHLSDLMHDWHWMGEIGIQDVLFKYDEHWLPIDKIQGALKFNNRDLTILVSKSEILETPTEEIVANIRDIGKANDLRVEVEGSLHSHLEKGLEFLQLSPLKESVFKKLDILNPKGPMRLNLKLNIPLSSDELLTQVNGRVSVVDGTLSLSKWDALLTSLKGDFDFTRESLESSNAEGKLLEQALNIQIKTESIDKNVQLDINVKSLVSTKWLKDYFPSSYWQYITGETLIESNFKIPIDKFSEQPIHDWTLKSNLQGVQVLLPFPLGKEISEKRSVSLGINTREKNEYKITLTDEDLIDSKWIFTYGDEIKLKEGQIVFGKQRVDGSSSNALFVGGHVSRLNVSEWKSFLDKLPSGGISLPTIVQLGVSQFEVFDLLFNDTKISMNSNKGKGQWVFEGPELKGVVTLPEKSVDRFNLNLDILKLKKEKVTKEEISTKNLLETNKPLMFFHCKHLQYGEADFGEVNFRLIPKPYGYDIQNLSAKTETFQLIANGKWQWGTRTLTRLEGQLSSDNMGRALKQLGYPSVMRGSEGKIQFNFTWSEDPMQFDFAKVQGEAHFNLRAGRVIVGVDSGLGRIIGLLNLDNIRRRLQLDFSDLFRKGFVFDTLKSNLNFNQGIIKTEELSIDGPSARIELGGHATVKNKGVDLKMAVTPKVVGAGLPLAAALAGGPAVGAGVWVMDKFFGSRLGDIPITRYYYHVTGTWDSPTIEEIGYSSYSEKRKAK